MTDYPKPLLTDADLAEILGLPVRRLQEIRLREQWPHIKIGRTYRYGPDEVAEIIRRHQHKGKAPLVGLPDQTEESIRRSQRPRQATRLPDQTEENWRRSR